MALPAYITEMVAGDSPPPLEPKRGEAIFAGTDYPRAWDGFIGQADAKEQLRTQVASAIARGTRIEHTLIASGIHGVGKTTLATLVAYQAGAGFIQTSGPLTVQEFRALAKRMTDHDVLFVDELHLLVSGNKNKADWLLPFMTEGVLYTERGPEQMPDVAIIGATTDVGKLPETLISRFMVQPTIVNYSEDEAADIAGQLSKRMGIPVPPDAREPIATAANRNPRTMRRILTAIRDLGYTYPESHPNLDKAFAWSGVSADGLSSLAREILAVLLVSKGHQASLDSIKAILGEPGPIRHHEQALLQRGLVEVTGQGRRLTDAGVRRARQEMA